jgi:hypothetical protein
VAQRLALLGAFLASSVLLLPGIARADSPADGSQFYTDETIELEASRDLTRSYCWVEVTGPDGSTTKSDMHGLGNCNGQVTLTPPLAPGTYSWQLLGYIDGLGTGVYPWRSYSFSVVERPRPTPLPPPPPAPVQAPTTPPQPTPAPAPTQQSAAPAEPAPLLAPASAPAPSPAPVPTPPAQPPTAAARPPAPATPPATPLAPAKVWAFISSGFLGGLARLRVASEAKAKYSSFAVTVQSKRATIKTLVAPIRNRGLIQEVKWHVPAGVAPQSLRFCVVGKGTPDLVSAKSCSTLALKNRPSHLRLTKP